jgi:hypothetical protein
MYHLPSLAARPIRPRIFFLSASVAQEIIPGRNFYPAFLRPGTFVLARKVLDEATSTRYGRMYDPNHQPKTLVT